MFKKNTQNQRIVMAFGTFDILHEGHENYLKHAASLGDFLIVVIARDKTVKQIKTEFSLNNERQRLQNLKKSGLADKVVLGYHDDKYKVIRKFRPDVIALGYDQVVFTQKLNKILIDLKLNTEIHRMDAFFPQVFKSSLLRQKAGMTSDDPEMEVADSMQNQITSPNNI